MSIIVNLNLKTNPGTVLECDLEEYLNNFNDLVDDIYDTLELETPIDIHTQINVDHPVFKSITDIETFLSITFPYTYTAQMYIEWIKETNSKFQDYKIFNDKYIGRFISRDDFINHFMNTYMTNIHQYIKDSIDPNKLWDNHIVYVVKEIRIEDQSVDGVSMYINAYFFI